MRQYVVGFIFSSDHKLGLFIEKNRPAFQRGKLNGVGGRVEPDETATQAMVRECREECGLQTELAEWELQFVLSEAGDEVSFYALWMTEGRLRKAIRLTDERLVIVNLTPAGHSANGHSDPESAQPFMFNLNWMIPLCFDTDIVKPVVLKDRHLHRKNPPEPTA